MTSLTLKSGNKDKEGSEKKMKLKLKTVLPEKDSLINYRTLDLKYEGNTSYLSPLQGIGLIERVRTFLKAIADFIKTRTFVKEMYKSLYINFLNKRHHLSEVFMKRKFIGFKEVSDCGGHSRKTVRADNHLVFEGSKRRKYQ